MTQPQVAIHHNFYDAQHDTTSQNATWYETKLRHSYHIAYITSHHLSDALIHHSQMLYIYSIANVQSTWKYPYLPLEWKSCPVRAGLCMRASGLRSLHTRTARAKSLPRASTAFPQIQFATRARAEGLPQSNRGERILWASLCEFWEFC
jgi:hypothetical protein